MDRRSFLKSSFLGAAALSLLGPGACRVRSRFDTLIKHGWIYAGDGKPPVRGDIALRDGKIAAIGTDLGSSADLVLDADGLAVSPGFIDLHSHTDTNLFDAPNGDSRIFQGITSEVGGNCGYCPFTGDTETSAKPLWARIMSWPRTTSWSKCATCWTSSCRKAAWAFPTAWNMPPAAIATRGK